MQVFALPIGAIACVIVAALWIYCTPVTINPVANPTLLILCLISLIPVHELAHALIHPGLGLSRQTVIGFWPSRLIAYAHFDGKLSRERFLMILAMPVVVLSLLPLLCCLVLKHGSVTLAFFSSLNMLAAGGDLFGIGLLLWQVPRKATVLNEGWKTYWKV